MVNFYNRSDFEKKFAEVEIIEDKESDEYFFKYMKIVISFGRPVRISQLGYDEGLRLYGKWKNGEELSREEIITVGFLLVDICVLEEDSKMMDDVKTIYNQMVTKYNPDFPYMQEFGQIHLLKKGYVEENPNYMKTVEQMFSTDFVAPDPDQVRMIHTGEMPIYDDVKVCPYCGKQFGDNTEELFKHVKSVHDKK